MANDYIEPLDIVNGVNIYDGGPGDDKINGADGINSIIYEVGDGVDTVDFAAPRTYQFAGYRDAAEAALAAGPDGHLFDYSNEYFGTTNSDLFNRLPQDIQTTLYSMKAFDYGEGNGGVVLGSVDWESAQTAFLALIDWIDAPVSNIIKFGPGITPANITVQLGRDTQFGVPYSFGVAVNGSQGIVFNMLPPELVAGAVAPPPTIDIVFEFDNGDGTTTTTTLADMLGSESDGIAGSQTGTEDGDMLTGSLANDEIYGNGGDDRIDARAGKDGVYGGAGNDVLSGGAGNDIIQGDDGDDVIAGGRDGAIASGGYGNDVYLFNAGDGALTIDNWPGMADDEADTISFGGGLNPDNVMAYADESGKLTLLVPGSGDQIETGWFRQTYDDDGNFTGYEVMGDQAISNAQFVDASGNVRVFDLAQLVGDNQAALLGATADAPIALFALGTHEVTGAVEPVGGEYALRYAATGSVFEAPASGGGGDTDVNHAASGAVTVAGTASEDHTLTADMSGVTDADGMGAMNYQWARSTDGGASWSDVSGATGASYALGDSDVGSQMRVNVSYTDGHGHAESLTSAASAVVANVNDAPAGEVTVAGMAAEDQTLTADAGSVADADGMGAVTYQWARSTDGGTSWSAISGANSNSYTLGDSDVGSQVHVSVTYADGHGTTESLTSVASAVVANVNDAPTGGVSVSGTASEDHVLTADISSVADVDGLGAMSYQWARSTDGGTSWTDISGATGATYMLGDSDVGSRVHVNVSYSDGHGTPESLTSAASAVVANVNDAATGGVSVTGTAREDQTLTANSNVADADGLGALGYQWTRSTDGGATWQSISGATSNTYKLGDSDVDSRVRVSVSYTDGHGTVETVTSAATGSVANVNDAPTGAVGLTGNATEDQILMANTGSIADADGLGAFSYQWARSTDGGTTWSNVSGATGSSYALGDADVGGRMRVSVSYTDGHGTAQSLTSAMSAAVANVNDAPVLVQAIADQSAQAGQAFSMTLPADAFRDADVGDVLTYAVRMADGSALPSWLSFNATTRTLSGTPTGVPANARMSMQLQVVATDTKGMSANDIFALNVDGQTPPPPPVQGKNLRGGNGNDVLTGGAGNDTLDGRAGKDVLNAGAGNDTLNFYADSSWSGRRSSRRTNAGSPDYDGSGERVSIKGKGQSQDIFNGGSGVDTLVGTSSADAILLDDTKSSAQQSGPRLVGIEIINAGAGDDVVDLTSSRYTYGDVTVDGGTGNDVIWTNEGNDTLLGGAGNDRMDGGAGKDYLSGGSGDDVMAGGNMEDILQGGSGNDSLSDISPTAGGLMDGGAGNDILEASTGRTMFIGGTGDDTIQLAGGTDIIAYNRGDGRDTVKAGNGGDATLSLGAGIKLQDLAFRRSGDSLMLETGGGGTITFDNWYRGRSYQAVSKLQFVTDGVTGGGTLLNQEIETFDFKKLVGAFDNARKSNPGLSKWALTNGLASFDLGGSDHDALGGELAHTYGATGSLVGIGVSAAQEIISSSSFGVGKQGLKPRDQMTAGDLKLA